MRRVGISLLSERGCRKQFSGTTLNFVSENVAPTTAIAANLNGSRLTGININVLQLELGALVQKIALDIARARAPTRLYAGPYQIMAPTTTRSPT